MLSQVYHQSNEAGLDSGALLQSFFVGGFECSTHRSHSGRQLDLIAATGHDRHALADYRRLQAMGITVARDGLRWHLIEQTPGRYDFSSVLPLLRAARETGVQVIWDLCHYGWPTDIDIFKPEFVKRFARLARAFAHLLANETETIPFICPVNEISFFSWVGGEVGWFCPYGHERGLELKTQLVRAAIEGIEAFRDVLPGARIVHTDPLINVIAHPDTPQDAETAAGYTRAQFDAWDMLCGRTWPQLGGHEKYLDIMGLNYYVHNQWFYPERTMIPPSHPLYRPFRNILQEVYERYRRPMFIAETGIENEERPSWLRYICGEVLAAKKAGVPLEGICLYPIVNHPGWEDDRHCYNGLWDYADENGHRIIYEPFARELRRQMRLFDEHLQSSDNRNALLVA